jgi:hypothetical protein
VEREPCNGDRVMSTAGSMTSKLRSNRVSLGTAFPNARRRTSVIALCAWESRAGKRSSTRITEMWSSRSLACAPISWYGPLQGNREPHGDLGFVITTTGSGAAMESTISAILMGT